MSALLKTRSLQDEDFEALSVLFVRWTGNKFGSDKRSLLESRLLRRFSETKTNPKEYLQLVKKDISEREYFISALTTHKTDWFREPIHIEFMVETILKSPSRNQQPWNIWSAACSSGEEIYSIGMSLFEKDVTNFRILGTDISEPYIKKAEAGIYAASQVDEQVPDHLKIKYFKSCHSEKRSKEYEVHPALKNNLKLRKFNLMDDELTAKVSFDFIFIRNVLIYFSKEDVHHVVGRLKKYLKPGGFFITGLSEHLGNEKEYQFRRVGNSIYRYDV